jgi:hypothetical protein
VREREFRRELAQALQIRREAKLDREILPFDVAGLVQTLA